jgi:hypothetical protein
MTIARDKKRKRELDRIRNEWRKKHRILNGRIILWPDKSPEHINARASKVYNWFWKKILINLNQHDIPAIISNIKKQINSENDPKKIRTYRTMISMAEDAYQLKNLEDIMDYDTEIMYEKNPIYNSEQGIIFKDGRIFTTDYSEDESEILIRDYEGTIVDTISYGNGKQTISETRNNNYKNWDYLDKT